MYPVSKQHLSQAMERMLIPAIEDATIRQISALSSILQSMAGDEPMVHLEMGNPGLQPEEIGIKAQCDALMKGVAKNYPNVAGIPELKLNASRFLKAFLDVNIPGRCIIPTVGSMQGSFTLELLLGQRIPGRDAILFIHPGFPAQHHQAKVLGLERRSFDIYDYRGEALAEKLEKELADGRVTAIIYSNPNNPAWINLTEDELRIIGEAATRHDVIVMEDLAYMGMDFRSDFGKPGEPPFIPTVARYTDNYILLMSASKIFSYAGERVAVMCFSPAVFDRQYKFYTDFYDMPALGDAYVFGVLYVSSSGVSHSSQYAMAAMLEAAVEGRLNFVDKSREYGHRAHRARKLFMDNGFHLVYALDGDRPISDGFFFTVGYPGLTGPELQQELLRYGISTISLPSTGSEQHGVRVTVSMLTDEETFDNLNKRLTAFHNDRQS